MKLGIVGLPNVGKSTLFNCLTQAGAESANYPFCTIDPNVGVAAVPDPRLAPLSALYHSEKTTPALVEFVDIAGLVRGASKGEGLGNQFLSHIREVDALVHVVRCFEDGNVAHVDGSVNPGRDVETIRLELILSDLEAVERRLAKTGKSAKADRALQKELDLLLRLQAALEEGRTLRALALDAEEQALVSTLNLLSGKKILYAANVSEGDIPEDGAGNPHVAAVKAIAAEEGAEIFVVCAKIEAEIAELDEGDRREFLRDLGLEQGGLDKLVAAAYKLLGLASFLTAGPKETRAWTIPAGAKAPQAAGKIHTDFERGFIRAEIVHYDDLIRLGSYPLAKERGLVRLEGKDYVMRDGDVVLFRFNV
jgi:GTP-binding protein YchF